MSRSPCPEPWPHCNHFPRWFNELNLRCYGRLTPKFIERTQLRPTADHPTPAPEPRGPQAQTATPASAAHGAVRHRAAPPAPDHRRRPGATLAVTSAATAVALMNYTAPMVTLPAIAAALHTPLSAQAWLLNGTPLGLAALLLVAGSLADDYGRRRIFLVGTLRLGITTALGALATDTWLFTLARIAQGAASAAILASSLGLIVARVPDGRRAAAGRRACGARSSAAASRWARCWPARWAPSLAAGLRASWAPPRWSSPRFGTRALTESPRTARRPPRPRGRRDLRPGPGRPGGGPHAGPGRLAAGAGVACCWPRPSS